MITKTYCKQNELLDSDCNRNFFGCCFSSNSCLLVLINEIVDDLPLVVGQQDPAQLRHARAQDGPLQDSSEGSAEVDGPPKVLPAGELLNLAVRVCIQKNNLSAAICMPRIYAQKVPFLR